MIRKPKSFETKIEISRVLLERSDLFLRENRRPARSSALTVAKKRGYADIWKGLIEESCFRILLKDYSFFTFFYTEPGDLITMSYYGNPYLFISLDDYIVEEYGEEYLMFKDDPVLIEEYEQSVVNSTPLESPVTFRYDYAPAQYDAGRHPVSHMHFGYGNQIRVGCEKVLNPLSFVAFVIRQQYPEIWQTKVLRAHASLCKSSIRSSIPTVPEKYVCDHDRMEMYLG